MSDQTPTPPTGPTQPVPPTPAAPVTQAAPVMPPPAPPAYGSTPGTPPPAGGYFASSKNKTIALIVGGVVAIGAIGGVAALLAGGGDDKTVEASATAPQGSGVLDPAPVENTDPAPVEPPATTEPTPTEAPSAPATEAPAPTPTPEPAPAPAPSGDSIVLAGNVVVPVPTDWKVFGSDDTGVAMGKGNDFVYAVVGTVKPSADAGQVLSNSLESVLPPEQYPDVRTTDVQPQQAAGSIVSFAMLEYEATWTDGQGTVPVHGAVFSAVRQDGTALILLGEHSPPEEFADAWPTLQAVLDPILLGFAGLS